MNTRPFSVSVALCTYNGEKFLRAQLDSLTKQSRLPDELIVFDDCSRDGTRDILEEFEEASPFPVKLFFNDTNLGSTVNFSHACQACSCDWISLCDQDDVWLPQKLERLESSVTSHADVLVVFSDAEMVDEDLNPLGYRLWEAIRFGKTEQSLFREGHPLCVLRRKFVVTGMTMSFRSDQLQYVLPIDPSWVHDGWIAYCLAVRGAILPINESLALYRQHGSQQIGEKKRNLWETYAWAKQLGTTHLRQQRQMFAALQNQLVKTMVIHNQSGCHPIVEELREKVSHLDARIWARESIVRRPFALGEYLNGRYGKFSFGWKSFVQDLIA